MSFKKHEHLLTSSSGPWGTSTQRKRVQRSNIFSQVIDFVAMTRNRARSFDVKVRAGDSFDSFFSCPQSTGKEEVLLSFRSPALVANGKVVKGTHQFSRAPQNLPEHGSGHRLFRLQCKFCMMFACTLSSVSQRLHDCCDTLVVPITCADIFFFLRLAM